jgi:hypothetical protein
MSELVVKESSTPKFKVILCSFGSCPKCNGSGIAKFKCDYCQSSGSLTEIVSHLEYKPKKFCKSCSHGQVSIVSHNEFGFVQGMSVKCCPNCYDSIIDSSSDVECVNCKGKGVVEAACECCRFVTVSHDCEPQSHKL